MVFFPNSAGFVEAVDVGEKQQLCFSLNSDICHAKIIPAASFASFFCKFLSSGCIFVLTVFTDVGIGQAEFLTELQMGIQCKTVSVFLSQLLLILG